MPRAQKSATAKAPTRKKAPVRKKAASKPRSSKPRSRKAKVVESQPVISNVVDMHQWLIALSEKAQDELEVDFAEVRVTDTVAIQLIAALRQNAEQKSCQLKLKNVPERLVSVAEEVGMSLVL